MNASLRALALAAALLGPAAVHAAEPSLAPAPRPSARELAPRLDAVEKGLVGTEEGLHFVETQFTQRAEPNDEEARARRFSDGEIQYLLGDWPAASVLFYDLVSDPRFRANPRYPDALFYLADSLLEQRNFIGARLYLRELLALPPTTRHYREALSRYLTVAGRLNYYEGVEAYVEQARALSGGQLPPEIAYVHAKWLFRRTDLAPAERIARARAAFTPLAQAPSGPWRLQAAYHLGVLSVQEGDLPAAIARFQQLATPPSAQAAQAAPGRTGPRRPAPTPEEEARRVREVALLSLGRLLYETGRFDDALDRYGQVPRDSESFPDSLYESAWVHVRQGHYQQAKNALDILLLVAPDSQLAAEGRILQGNLLQKLRRYDEATDAYTHVIDTFRPARDQVDALLGSHRDPVTYFDRLLGRADGSLDVSALLPSLVLKYATTQREVADAVRLVDDLDSGRRGRNEAAAIARRILQALDTRALETFPELQEANTRADAVDTALTHAEAELVRVETLALEGVLTPDELARLTEARHAREALERRFATLPTTLQELEARRERMQRRVDEVDREAHKLTFELQSLHAIAASVRKWVDDSRPQRTTPPDEEREFLLQLQAEVQTLTDLQTELAATRARLADERNAVDTSLAGERAIRVSYAESLRREHALLREAEPRADSEAQATLRRTQAVRRRLDGLRERVTTARTVLRERLEQRGRVIREKVVAEQQLLERYEAEVAAVSGDARFLVGRIAYDSIRRVRQQFYDLVLKADVGVVDVAFNEKQDKTTDIQTLSTQKDEALRELDAEFRDVLSEVKE
ncbi:tetratricopeptide repeat protein [Myxococcus sp. Y35]|uniref:tetratricopeptide repeat protein n=1 Tax=Pseudomyxococcus flavus TaxID=3115648 RepID=UPI003CEC7431